GPRPDPLRRWFAPDPREHGRLALRVSHDDDPAKRLALVEALITASASIETDPSLCVLLRQERRHLEPRVSWERDQQGFRRALRTLRQELYAYQEVGVERFL